VASVEREIDRLYELPLDRFTAARNELARRLKKEGDAEAAERVRALEKPSLPVWAINQLARREKLAVKALVDSTARVRKAQERALGGAAAQDSLRKAQADEHDALHELAARVERILGEGGRPATRAVVDRVRSTLRSAAVTDPAALRRGQLTTELASVGFEALGGVTVRKGEPTDELAERRRRKQERDRRRKDLEASARELEGQAQAAEDEADRADRAASEARDRADQAREEADEAADALEAFEHETDR
jgi:hypothetical protein